MLQSTIIFRFGFSVVAGNKTTKATSHYEIASPVARNDAYHVAIIN